MMTPERGFPKAEFEQRLAVVQAAMALMILMFLADPRT